MVNGDNINQLAAPAVTTDSSLGGGVLDLLGYGLKRYIDKELPERSPPVNQTLNNTDTARGELMASFKEQLTPVTIAAGAALLIGVVVIAIIAARGLK